MDNSLLWLGALLFFIVLVVGRSIVTIKASFDNKKIRRANKETAQEIKNLIEHFSAQPVQTLLALNLPKYQGGINEGLDAQFFQELKKQLEKIVASHEGRNAIEEFYTSTYHYKTIVPRHLNSALNIAIFIPDMYPDESHLVELALRCIKPNISASVDLNTLYQNSLGLVEKHSMKPHFKRFALEIGRLHYAVNREDRVPTIYDEQAIQNDISARIN